MPGTDWEGATHSRMAEQWRSRWGPARSRSKPEGRSSERALPDPGTSFPSSEAPAARSISTARRCCQDSSRLIVLRGVSGEDDLAGLIGSPGPSGSGRVPAQELPGRTCSGSGIGSAQRRIRECADSLAAPAVALPDPGRKIGLSDHEQATPGWAAVRLDAGLQNDRAGPIVYAVEQDKRAQLLST